MKRFQTVSKIWILGADIQSVSRFTFHPIDKKILSEICISFFFSVAHEMTERLTLCVLLVRTFIILRRRRTLKQAMTETAFPIRGNSTLGARDTITNGTIRRNRIHDYRS